MVFPQLSILEDVIPIILPTVPSGWICVPRSHCDEGSDSAVWEEPSQDDLVSSSAEPRQEVDDLHWSLPAF